MPETSKVNNVIHNSLFTSLVFSSDSCMKAPLMPIMVLMEIGEIYAFGYPKAPLVHAVQLETT